MMCFRRSVQLHGRALVEKGSQLVSCCQAVKMRLYVIAEEPVAYLYNSGNSH